MIKRLIILLAILFSFVGYSFAAGEAPKINCVGLPGCVDFDIANPTDPDVVNNLGAEYIGKIVFYIIQFVAVFAVFTMIFSGVMYMISAGNDDKVQKAKKAMIWSLVGVFLSISAWGIIRLLNTITIG